MAIPFDPDAPGAFPNVDSGNGNAIADPGGDFGIEGRGEDAFAGPNESADVHV